jgi:DDE superfamily endonuclease
MEESAMTHASGYHKRLQQTKQERAQHTKQRRRQKARDHLQRAQARAQLHLQALEQALVDLGLPETLAVEVEWRLKALGTLLGKIFGVMFPTLFGCRTAYELTRVRGWDKNLPGKILSALPKHKWVRQLQHRGQELLATLWHRVEDKSPATRSRWQWTWVGDDSVFKKYGQQLGLVGTWWSGQEHRVRLGIDGLLLVVVIGDGKLVIPVDFTVRRPDPVGPGHPCRDKLAWLRVMLDRTWAALQRRRLRLPVPLVVADSWFGDSKVMASVALQQHGTLLVEGKRTYVFHLSDGRRVTGHELLSQAHGPWRDSAQLVGTRYIRLTATSPTYGRVTLVLVEQPGGERYYLLCQATAMAAPRLIRAWKRRNWIEHHFRLLKHLLAAEACQVHGEAAYCGHLVLRLLAGAVLLYTARILLKGRVTMEEIVFSLKHHWRFLDSKDLELHALSWDLSLEAA